jgi:hypothetical protein
VPRDALSNGAAQVSTKCHERLAFDGLLLISHVKIATRSYLNQPVGLCFSLAPATPSVVMR